MKKAAKFAAFLFMSTLLRSSAYFVRLDTLQDLTRP